MRRDGLASARIYGVPQVRRWLGGGTRELRAPIHGDQGNEAQDGEREDSCTGEGDEDRKHAATGSDLLSTVDTDFGPSHALQMAHSRYSPAWLVAVATERVMGSNWRTYNERHKVMKLAQQLARSGQHADHTTIIPLLRDMEGFEAARIWFEAPAMRLQLDRLCAAARKPRGSGLSLSELRQSRRLQAGSEAVRGACQKASR